MSETEEKPEWEQLKFEQLPPAELNMSRIFERYPELAEFGAVLLENTAILVFDVEDSTKIQATSPELALEMTRFAHEFTEIITSTCNSKSQYLGSFYALKSAGDEIAIAQSFEKGSPISTIDSLIFITEVQQIYSELLMAEDYKNLRDFYIKKNSTEEHQLIPDVDLISTIQPGLFLPAIDVPFHLALRVVEVEQPTEAENDYEMLVIGEATIAKTLADSWPQNKSSVGTMRSNGVITYLTLPEFLKYASGTFFNLSGIEYSSETPKTLKELEEMRDNLLLARKRLLLSADENETSPAVIDNSFTDEQGKYIPLWEPAEEGLIASMKDKLKPVEEIEKVPLSDKAKEIVNNLAEEAFEKSRERLIDTGAVSYLNIGGFESMRRELVTILQNKGIPKPVIDIVITESLADLFAEIYLEARRDFEEAGWRIKETEYIETHEYPDNSESITTIAATNGNFVLIALKGDLTSQGQSLVEKDLELMRKFKTMVEDKRLEFNKHVHKHLNKQGISINLRKSLRKSLLNVSIGLSRLSLEDNLFLVYRNPTRVGGTGISHAARLAHSKGEDPDIYYGPRITMDINSARAIGVDNQGEQLDRQLKGFTGTQKIVVLDL